MDEKLPINIRIKNAYICVPVATKFFRKNQTGLISVSSLKGMIHRMFFDLYSQLGWSDQRGLQR